MLMADKLNNKLNLFGQSGHRFLKASATRDNYAIKFTHLSV